MDDTASKENPAQDLNAAERRPNANEQNSAASGGEPQGAFNKIDLTQLQGFSFGTQWTQDKSGAADNRDRSDQRPRREGSGDGPSDRRDRRAFRRPEGAPQAPGDNRAPAGAPVRREPLGDRRPARQDSRDFRGGARPGGERPSFPPGRGNFQDRTPYDSPHFLVTFYPEDTSFGALVKTIRASCRTIELFEIARTVLGKLERFTVLVARKDAAAAKPSISATTADEAGNPKPSTEAPLKPEVAKPPLFISVPDGLPFESEESAIAHVLSQHLKLFFDMAETEVEPPKGNFQVVNRCGVTGELLSPPNYHRYSQIVQQHYTAKAIRIPFEAYRSRIETVREPEAIAQWLEKMKRITRYTWKDSKKPALPAVASAKSETAAPAPAQAAVETPAELSGPTEPPAAPENSPPAETAPKPEIAAAPEAAAQPESFFDSLEEARVFLLTHARDKMVRPAVHARFHGRALESLPTGEIHRAVEGALERQRRFPLDTANALRGRLRREHFTIFKKGAKGVSYVCAVKRKFRLPGQTFAESIGALIGFIEAHPMIKAGELVTRFLGVAEKPSSDDLLANVPTVEQRAQIGRMQGDLLWLVREGYVTEFIDGSLYAPPPMVEARKKEVEHGENDPENFPDRPASTEAPAPEAEAAVEPEPSITSTPVPPEAPASVDIESSVAATPASDTMPAASEPAPQTESPQA